MNEEQKALYEYLVDYVTDEETAKIIIDGGEQGFYYGSGGYVAIEENEVEEYINNDYMVVNDVSLGNIYLVGSPA